MGYPAKRPATWEDLLAYPEGSRVEIIDGELITSPRPLPSHQRIQGRLFSSLDGSFDDSDGPSGWWILQDVDILLYGSLIVAPDLVGWRRERMPELTDERPQRTVPDWVCEILSPTTARYDRLTKADCYLRAGVGWMWLVDPAARTIEAYRWSEQGWLRTGAWGDDAPARIPPFDAIDLPLPRIFPPPPPAKPEAERG